MVERGVRLGLNGGRFDVTASVMTFSPPPPPPPPPNAEASFSIRVVMTIAVSVTHVAPQRSFVLKGTFVVVNLARLSLNLNKLYLN